MLEVGSGRCADVVDLAYALPGDRHYGGLERAAPCLRADRPSCSGLPRTVGCAGRLADTASRTRLPGARPQSGRWSWPLPAYRRQSARRRIRGDPALWLVAVEGHGLSLAPGQQRPFWSAPPQALRRPVRRPRTSMRGRSCRRAPFTVLRAQTAPGSPSSQTCPRAASPSRSGPRSTGGDAAKVTTRRAAKSSTTPAFSTRPACPAQDRCQQAHSEVATVSAADFFT